MHIIQFYIVYAHYSTDKQENAAIISALINKLRQSHLFIKSVSETGLQSDICISDIKTYFWFSAFSSTQNSKIKNLYSKYLRK